MHTADPITLLTAAGTRFGIPVDAIRAFRTPPGATTADLHRATIAFLAAARDRGLGDDLLADMLGWSRVALVNRRAALHDLRFAAAVTQAIASWNADVPPRPVSTSRRHVCAACGGPGKAAAG